MESWSQPSLPPERSQDSLSSWSPSLQVSVMGDLFDTIQYLKALTLCSHDLPGHLIGSPIDKRLNIFYSIIGCALFITSGVFIIESWEKSFRTKTRDLAMAKGSVAIINGAMFFLDTVFTYRDNWVEGVIKWSKCVQCIINLSDFKDKSCHNLRIGTVPRCGSGRRASTPKHCIRRRE